MSTSKKFSELPAASSVGNGDLFAIAHEDALAETGYVSQKLTAAQAGQKVNGDTEYPTSLPSFPANGQNPFAALEKLNSDIEALYPVNTASGSIANFTTSLAKPLTELTSTIVAQQAGTGTPSPSNPRSISGFSAVSFYQRGVNLWDEDWEVGAIDASGNNSTNNNRIRTKGFIKVIPSNTYYIKSPNNIWLWGYDDKKVFKERIPDTSSISNRTITIPSGVYYIRFVVVDAYGTTYNNDISINYPSTDTSYHAYNPQSETKTIALPETIYGGSVDCIGGTARIEKELVTVGENNTFLISSQTSTTATIRVSGFTLPTGTADITISNRFDTSLPSDTIGKYSVYGTTYLYFVVDITELSTVDADGAKAWFLANQTDVLILKSAVEEIDITSNNFTTFAGEQNIFSDCGDISVSFKQGIQEYIDAKIAETQALILNS